MPTSVIFFPVYATDHILQGHLRGQSHRTYGRSHLLTIVYHSWLRHRRAGITPSVNTGPNHRRQTSYKRTISYFYHHVASAIRRNLRSDLVSTLTGLDVNDFTHFYRRKYTINTTRTNRTNGPQLNNSGLQVIAGRQAGTGHPARSISLRRVLDTSAQENSA